MWACWLFSLTQDTEASWNHFCKSHLGVGDSAEYRVPEYDGLTDPQCLVSSASISPLLSPGASLAAHSQSPTTRRHVGALCGWFSSILSGLVQTIIYSLSERVVPPWLNETGMPLLFFSFVIGNTKVFTNSWKSSLNKIIIPKGHPLL